MKSTHSKMRFPPWNGSTLFCSQVNELTVDMQEIQSNHLALLLLETATHIQHQVVSCHRHSLPPDPSQVQRRMLNPAKLLNKPRSSPLPNLPLQFVVVSPHSKAHPKTLTSFVAKRRNTKYDVITESTTM